MRLGSTVSAKLLKTLRRGRERLDEGSLEMIRDFVASQRTRAGGFAGKSGKDDIYYTLFGWTLSEVLGMKVDGGRMKAYLDGLAPEGMDSIHRAAYTRCVMLQKMAAGGNRGVLKHLLARGGKDARAEMRDGGTDSPYNCFIRLSLAEDSGRSVTEGGKITEAMRAYRVPGGGYSNIPGADTPTTNATAAALVVAGQTGGYRRGEDSRFLRGLQHSSGGFAAVPGAPVPDLLSTATALFALRLYGEEPKYPASDFIEGHWLPSGGFAATLPDDSSDAEYTFYGLLALGAS